MPGLADTCGICGGTFPYSLPRCRICRRAVCGDCGTRVAGATFCSRTCSHSFFYGGEEDVQEGSADSDSDADTDAEYE